MAFKNFNVREMSVKEIYMLIKSIDIQLNKNNSNDKLKLINKEFSICKMYRYTELISTISISIESLRSCHLDCRNEWHKMNVHEQLRERKRRNGLNSPN